MAKKKQKGSTSKALQPPPPSASKDEGASTSTQPPPPATNNQAGKTTLEVPEENNKVAFPAKKTRSTELWTNVRKSVGAVAGESYRQRSEKTIEEAHEGNMFNSNVSDRKEAESKKILEVIMKSNFFQNLPEKNRKAVLEEQERKAGKIHALDVLAMRERGETVDSDQEEEYTKDRKRREKEQEDYRLRHLWTKRHCLTNWFLWFLFHLVVLVNFALCIIESYMILIEDAKFDRLYLNDDYNCLDRVESGDWVNHLFNILHACTCVAVLFTDHLNTANVCWTYVIACLCHVSCDTFQFFYNVRFPHEDKSEDSSVSIGLFILYLSFMTLSTLVVIHRYYDMTNILQTRTTRFTASLYTGRLLNEHIIYKNESSFLQKKYTLRQAQSLQIYGIVQKLEHYKQRGLEPDPLDIQYDVNEAIETLKDLKNYSGSNLLRELRKRNEERLRRLEAMDSLDEIGVDAQGDHHSRRDRIRRTRMSRKSKKSIKFTNSQPIAGEDSNMNF